MRIICPGCGAEYAIPDNAVPAAGREVQCAACTHAWYQLPAFPTQEPPAETGPVPAGGAAAPAPDPVAGAAHAPAAAAGPEMPERRIGRLRAALDEAARGLSPGAAAPVSPDDAPPGPAPAPAAAAGDDDDRVASDEAADPPAGAAPPPRRIDPGVLRILREEAAFEARARAGAAPMRLTPAQERLARLQQAERDGGALDPADSEAAVEDPDAARHVARPPLIRAAAPDAPGDPKPAARATPPVLRPGANGRDLPVRLDPRGLADYRARQHRKGFRMGYGASLGICCAALALYLGAPQMARWLPAGTPLAEMVIDHGDRVQAALLDALRAMLATAPAAPPAAPPNAS